MNQNPETWNPKRSLLVALLLSSFVIRASSFAAESPLYIPFQGQVTNQAGVLSADGQYSVIFNLYDQAVGGQPVWSERHVKIGVTRGMINVFLGSISPLTSVDFSQTKYLGITVDTDNLATTADPEMVPRSLIMPAFHAKKAEISSNSVKLNGFDWSSLLTGGINDPSTGTLRGDKLASASVSNTKLATNAVQNGQIQDAAVTGAKISNGAITASHMSDNLQADALIPPGTVVAFASVIAPAGWRNCDGSSQLKTDPVFARLFAAIGTEHGTTDALHFNLPDYRGRFLRGSDFGAGRDPGPRIVMNPNGNGNGVGSIQADAFQGHRHGLFSHITPNGNSNGFNVRNISDISVTDNAQNVRDPTTDGTNGTPRVASETRPINAAVNYIIKL